MRGPVRESRLGGGKRGVTVYGMAAARDASELLPPRGANLLHWMSAYSQSSLTVLAQGTDAVVHSARPRHDNGLVALKIPKSRVTLAEAGNEIEILRRLQGHPNIVRVLGVFRKEVDERGAPSAPWAVALSLASESLSSFLRRQPGARPPPQVYAILESHLLCAVAHVHKAGILHRDVKPSNILVSNDEDGKLRAILADFGRARDVSNAPTRRISDKHACTHRGVPLKRTYNLTPGVGTVVMKGESVQT